jgi:hypothetical protein
MPSRERRAGPRERAEALTREAVPIIRARAWLHGGPEQTGHGHPMSRTLAAGRRGGAGRSESRQGCRCPPARTDEPRFWPGCLPAAGSETRWATPVRSPRGAPRRIFHSREGRLRRSRPYANGTEHRPRWLSNQPERRPLRRPCNLLRNVSPASRCAGPPGLVAVTPAVRIRPCERVASSSSYLAARRTRWAPDGPRGVARAYRGSSAGSSALFGSALPASRFRRRSGIPFHTADRKPSLATFASHSLARPFRARTGERRRRLCSADDRCRDRQPRRNRTLLGFHPLQRMRSRGFGSIAPFEATVVLSHEHGLATPATFRPQRFARSRRLTPRNTARASFIPVTLLRFRLQGLVPPRGAAPLSRPPALLPFRRSPPPRSVGNQLRLQSFDPPGEFVPHRSENLARPLPS